MLRAAQRCMGPPSSPVQGFRLPELPSLCFISYGAGPGIVVIQQVQVNGCSTTVRQVNTSSDPFVEGPLVLDLALPGHSFNGAESTDGATLSVQAAIQQVSWTYAGGRCLLAAATSELVAIFELDWYFKCLANDEPPLCRQHGSSVAYTIKHSSAVAAISWTHAGDGLLVSGSDGEVAMFEVAEAAVQGRKTSCRLEEIWRGSFSTITEPQTLISAGAHSWSPAATGQPGKRTVAVWWPPTLQKKGSSQSQAAGKPPAEGSSEGMPASHFSSETSKILEKLGHEAGASNTAQFSTAQVTAGNAEHEAPVRDWTIAEQLRHPMEVISVQWSPGSLQRGHHSADEEEAAEFLPSSQPALLTVTADGVLRIWVEVTLSTTTGPNPFNTVAVPAIPGAPDGAHFCVTLVIQPPGGAWVGSTPRGLRAAWGAPEKGLLAVTGPQIRAAKVMWITAVAESEGVNKERCEKLLVWAVDGLAGVVLGTLPGAIAGGRPARSPRAVLWGQHQGQLSWACMPQNCPWVSVTVTLEADAPTLHVFESHHSRERGTGEFRVFTVETIEDEAVSPSAPPSPIVRNATRHLPLHNYAAYELLGHAASIKTLIACPTRSLALTLDTEGTALLWSTETVAPEHKLQTPSGKDLVSAVAWLDAGEANANCSLALLATANPRQLHVFKIAPGRTTAEHVAEASMPDPLSGHSVKLLKGVVKAVGEKWLLLGWLYRLSHAELAGGASGTTQAGRDAHDVLAVWELRGRVKEQPVELECIGWQNADGDGSPLTMVATAPWPLAPAAYGCANGGLYLLQDLRNGSFEACRCHPPAYSGEGKIVAASFGHGGKLAAAFHCNIPAAKFGFRVWDLGAASSSKAGSAATLQHKPVDVMWLPVAHSATALAVALLTRGIAIYVQDRRGCWDLVAQLSSIPLPSPQLEVTAQGNLLAVSGNQVCAISEYLDPDTKAKRGPQGSTLARLLHDSAGGRPEWHPQVLKLLLATGRLAAAAAALRVLLTCSNQEQMLLCPSLPPSALWNRSILQWAGQLASHTPDADIISSEQEDYTAQLGVGTANPAITPHRPETGSSTDPSIGQSAAQTAPQTAPQADPFAFDMAAFGGGGGSAPREAGESTPAADPFAFDMSAFGEDSVGKVSTQAEVAPAADPYAFDMSAFGASGTAGPSADQPETPARSVTDRDPFAFDMAAFEPSARLRENSPEPPKSQQARGSSASRYVDESPSWSQQQLGLGAEKAPAKHQLQKPPPFAKPQKEAFQPLTAKEVGDLRSLLGLEGQELQESSSSEDGSGREYLPVRQYGMFGSGDAARQAAEEVASLALLLSSGQPGSITDSPSLDAPAQHVAASVQLAVHESRGNQVEQPSTSGRSFEEASSRGQGGRCGPETWCRARLGLLDSLGAQAILWALISDSSDALSALCSASIPSEEAAAAGFQPKYDYTSKGHKTLDLGFGASRVASRGSNGHPTWEAMRKVGAGFWLQDAAAIRRHAETLAKAEFARTKDPSSCALFYTALGKKNLLQGLFRSATQHKQADFLARDFGQPKNQEAACKNAFVLLSQHRHELAAAFFVLGHSHKNAVGVCAHEMNDPQLALFLCNLLEGPGGPLSRELLNDSLLREAEEAGEMEATAVFHYILGNHREALTALLHSSVDEKLASSADESASASFAPAMAAARAAGKIDLIRHMVDAHPGTAVQVSQGKAMLSQVAYSCAGSLETLGAPSMALESLCVWSALEGAQQQQLSAARYQERKQQLAARALLKHLHTHRSEATLVQLLGTMCTSSSSDGSWRQSASAELEELQSLGCEVDAAAVLGLLGQMLQKLWPPQEKVAGLSSQQRADSAPSDLSRTSARRRSLQGSRPGRVMDNGKLFGEPYELVRIEGDKLHDVCQCNSDPGDWGTPGAEWRPCVVASGRHGLVDSEVSPPKGQFEDVISTATSESSHKGSTFSAILSEMLDAMRWPPDPWTMVAPLPGASVGEVPQARETSSLSNSPSHRSNHIATATLAAHPFRPLYLSGSATGEIYLWQFGKSGAVAGYTPLPVTAKAPPASPASLFSSSARSWNPTPGVNFSHWGQPQSVRFSECGERFAAIGEGGVVAAWRMDAPRIAASDTGALGRADWCHQGLTKRGVDVTFVGGSTSVLAAGGFCQQAGNIAIWDTLAPATSGPLARLFHHANMVTSLQALPGGRMLMSADEAGLLAAVDLRMVGGSGSRGRSLLWQARNPAGGVTCMATTVRPTNGLPLLVSGSRTGGLGVWSVNHGQLLQSMTADPSSRIQGSKTKGRSLFSEAMRAKSGAGAAVTGVAVCPEGLLSCTLHGVLHLHPFLI